MRKLATSETAQPGQSYERNRFEVHYLGDDNKSWFCLARNAKTLAEARGQLAEKVKDQRLLSEFIQVGPLPRMRIVEVKALCKVIE